MKGIPFSPAMLQAIVEGRKVQTRRLVKRPRGMSDAQWESAVPHNQGDGGLGVFGSAPYLRVDGDDAARPGERIRCPQGVAGARLWIKEGLVRDDDDFLTKYASDGEWARRDGAIVPWPWKPSKLAAMYCPRWASRETIELVSVRVERLHHIDEQDAIREGIEPIDFPRETFAKLWDAINGRVCPWASDPYVWRLEFRRCT